MRKFILRLVIIVLVVSGLVGSGWLNRATPASTCDIATRSTKIESGTLSYNQAGTGQPILLLHGLFAEKEQWNGMMCELAREHPDFENRRPAGKIKRIDQGKK